MRALAADEAVFDDREVVAVDHDGEFVRNADGDSVREDGSVLPDDAELAGAGGFVALGGDGGVAVLVVGVRDFDGHGGVGAHRVGDRRGGDLVALVRVDQTLGSGDDGRFGAVDDAGAVVDRAAVLEHAVRLAAEAGLARLGGVGLNDDVAGVGDGAGVVEREFEFRHRELTGVGRIRAGHVLLPVGPAVEIGILRRVVAIRVERDRTAHAHRALPGVRQTVAVVVELAVGETRGGIDLVVVGEARVARVGIGGIRSGLAFAPVVETVEVRVPGRTGEFVRHGAGLVLERDLVVVWIGRRGIVPRHAREAPQFVRERNLRINGIPRHQRRPLQRHARRLADVVFGVSVEVEPAEEPVVAGRQVFVGRSARIAIHVLDGHRILARCHSIFKDEIPKDITGSFVVISLGILQEQFSLTVVKQQQQSVSTIDVELQELIVDVIFLRVLRRFLFSILLPSVDSPYVVVAIVLNLYRQFGVDVRTVQIDHDHFVGIATDLDNFLVVRIELLILHFVAGELAVPNTAPAVGTSKNGTIESG